MKPPAVLAFLLFSAATMTAQPPVTGYTPKPGSPAQKIRAQLDNTIIPSFKVVEVTLPEAVDLIMKKAKEADPKSKPVSIVIDPGLLKPEPALDPQLPKLPELRLTLDVSNIPESELLRYVTRLASVNFRISFKGVAIEGCKIDEQQLLTMRYSLPVKFFGVKAPGDEKCAEILADLGIKFPTKASAHYDVSSKTLSVRDTEENLELVDAIVQYWRDHGTIPK